MAITYKKKLFNCSIISTTYLKIIEISKDFPILNNYQLNNKINKIIKLKLSIISFKMIWDVLKFSILILKNSIWKILL